MSVIIIMEDVSISVPILGDHFTAAVIMAFHCLLMGIPV